MEWLENLRKLKNNTDETYKSISEKTNIPQTTIEKLFNGRTKDPKLYMIREVVHCLGYTLDDLLENETATVFSLEEKRLLEKYRALNKEGRIKVIEYMVDLMQIPEYSNNFARDSDIRIVANKKQSGEAIIRRKPRIT